MYIDKQTLEDLSVFNKEEEFSIFHKIDFTQTDGGREWLQYFLSHPFDDLTSILNTQEAIRYIATRSDHWPVCISNGTIIMIEKFFETGLADIPQGNNFFQNWSYKTFMNADYGLVRFSSTHFVDFIKGVQQLIALFADDAPVYIRQYAERASEILSRKQLSAIGSASLDSLKNIFQCARAFKVNRHAVEELIDIYSRFDAWHSMAQAVKKYQLNFPVFVQRDTPVFEAVSLYHVLLPQPVPYDVKLDDQHNFMFLTGANMAGKSTLIKSVGAAVFLAQSGMGVPAASLRLSLFDGILSNIQVHDNIARGESYFYNEVQRIKNTILRISNGKKWLVLIDELFKGTNIKDAMNCSLAVIKGLIKIDHSLFILSTHLYEIGEDLRSNPNIIFRYFEIDSSGTEIRFSYHLKDGISNDRIGYLILQREKVTELLEKL
jgi:DNA mismatch repair ATPase MutS